MPLSVASVPEWSEGTCAVPLRVASEAAWEEQGPAAVLVVPKGWARGGPAARGPRMARRGDRGQVRWELNK